MDNQTQQFLLRILEENWRHARLSEEKRATLANLALLITFITQVVLAFTGFNRRVLPLPAFLIVCGIYAFAVNKKLYERAQFHTQRARKLRASLDQALPEAKVETLQTSAEAEHARRYAFWMKVRLHTIWLGLHLLIAVLGIVETLLCLL